MADIEKILRENDITPDSLEQPTSVPGDERKPSAIPGALVLGAAGIGALALSRVPGFNVLNKIATKRAPRDLGTLPKVVDEVEAIKDMVPTKVDRAKNLIAQTNPSRVNLQDEFEQLKKTTEIKPFSFGGRSKRFGSALFDFVAQHPSKKPLKADAWLNEFTNMNRLASRKIPGTNIKANITREELFDTNIAAFDKDGNLIDGYLKFAKDRNQPVRKEVLLRLINNSPAAGLTTKRMKYDQDMINRADKVRKDYEEVLKEADKRMDRILAERKNDEKFLNFYSAYRLSNQGDNPILDARRYTQDALETIQKLREGGKINDSGIYPETFDFTKPIKKFKKMVEISNEKQLGLGLDDLYNRLNTIQARGLASKREFDMVVNKKMYPKYGQEAVYKMPGSEDYVEEVVHYGKSMPFGRNVKSGEFGDGHFRDYENQLYHIRYGKRSLGDDPNKKVYAIDEIQADIQQRALEVDPTRSKVANPFGRYFEFEENNEKLSNLMNRMKTISDKKLSMTDADVLEFKKLKSEFEEIRKSSLNSDTIEKLKARYADKSVPFMPMFRRDVFGDHALKNTMKAAAEDGVDWVVVNPVERVALKRSDGNKLGNWEFYGGRDGKAGRPNFGAYSDRKSGLQDTNPKLTAVIPQRMKELAKQYNTEAKPISVSLSDPKKEFKVVRLNLHEERKKKMLGLTDDENIEVLAAFDNMDDAFNFNSRLSGNSKIIQMAPNDPRNYYQAFGIKITPEMKGTPFKLYKKEGGLVVNLFA